MNRKNQLLMLYTGVSLMFAAVPASVQSQAPYYQGKTIKFINNDPGGTAGLRVKVVMTHLRKYIPGNPTLIIEFVEGGGGRRAANQVFQNAKPDGLTVGALSSAAIGLQVMKETGVMYDIDKFIYLGTPVSENHNVIYTRRELGLNSLDKLRAASGLRLGAQEVGRWPTSQRGCSLTFSISKRRNSSPATIRWKPTWRCATARSIHARTTSLRC